MNSFYQIQFQYIDNLYSQKSKYSNITRVITYYLTFIHFLTKKVHNEYVFKVGNEKTCYDSRNKN